MGFPCQGPSFKFSERKLLTFSISLWRESVHLFSVPYFGELPVGVASVSPILEHWWDLSYSRCLGSHDNKRELGSLLLLQRTHGTAERSWHSLAVSPSGREEKSRMCTQCSGFLGGGLVLVSSDSDYRQDSELDRSLGPSEKKSWWLGAAPENLQYCTQTPEGARDYKLLRKKPTNLSWEGNWEISWRSPEKIHLCKKIWEDTLLSVPHPGEFLAGLIGEVLPLYEAIYLKCIFRCTKHNKKNSKTHEETGNMVSQRNKVNLQNQP